MRERIKAPREESTAVRRVDSERGAAAAQTSPPELVAELQRSVGNRAVAELLGYGQPKLAVGASDDRYEVEADAIARTVVGRLQEGGVGDHEHLGAHDDVSAPVRRVSEVGTRGGELSAETEADIQRARGGGAPLDRSTRTAMERAFGADFGAVRLHAGRAASNLSERVQAKAFTIGNDVFFKDALPDAKTKHGQELLAHELTHTLQQGGAGSVGRKVQRLAFNGTNWSQANWAQVSTGGGLGVLIIKDTEGPLIVKAGEAMTTEAMVAAKLLSEATGGGAGAWQASAPDTRAVDAREAKTIHDTARTLLGTSDREAKILNKLTEGDGVMVFGFAHGSEMKELLSQSQTKKGAFGSRSVRKDSVSHAIMNTPGLLGTLGRGAAADLCLGNMDRLIGNINFENMMLDLKNKKLSFIDNIQMRNEAFLRDAPEFSVTGKGSFDAWANYQSVRQLAGHQYDAIATTTLNALAKNMFGNYAQEIAVEDRKAVGEMFEKMRPNMQHWLAQGIEQGTANCRASMRDPTSFVGPVAQELKVPTATNLIARRKFLEGSAADAAWVAAESEAKALFAWKRATPLKASGGAPGDGDGNGNGNGNGNAPEPSGSTWQRASPRKASL